MNKRIKILYLFLLTVIVFVSSCKKDDAVKPVIGDFAVTAVEVIDTAATIRWTLAENAIEYELTINGKVYQSQYDEDLKEYYARINDLTPNTPYDIIVRATADEIDMKESVTTFTTMKRFYDKRIQLIVPGHENDRISFVCFNTTTDGGYIVLCIISSIPESVILGHKMIKLDADFQIEWIGDLDKMTSHGPTYYEIVETTGNNYYVANYCTVLKVDAQGNELWGLTMEGNWANTAITVLPDERLIVVGQMQRNDEEATLVGFCTCLSPEGTVAWNKIIPGEYGNAFFSDVIYQNEKLLCTAMYTSYSLYEYDTNGVELGKYNLDDASLESFPDDVKHSMGLIMPFSNTQAYLLGSGGAYLWDYDTHQYTKLLDVLRSVSFSKVSFDNSLIFLSMINEEVSGKYYCNWEIKNIDNQGNVLASIPFFDIVTHIYVDKIAPSYYMVVTMDGLVKFINAEGYFVPDSYNNGYTNYW
ncbi:MAG: hypothetical protein LBN06_02845 [Prevotellaceae bacterium]|jgi:hypothetical protein|nr:hypothetical protein [Prevotellaceae bacterium]